MARGGLEPPRAIRRPLASLSCSVTCSAPLSLLLSKEAIELLQSSLVCHRVQARVHPGRCITGFWAAKVSSRGPGRTNAPRAFADPSPSSPASSPASSSASSPAPPRRRCCYLKKRSSYSKAHWCATGFRRECIREGVSPASGRQKSRRVARGGLETPRAIRRPLASLSCSVSCSLSCLGPSSLPLSKEAI